jgi:hypothetical protein
MGQGRSPRSKRRCGWNAPANGSIVVGGRGAGRQRALANGVKFGRKRKLSDFQRAEAIKRRAAGESLTAIAKSYAVDISMISRLG